MQFQGKLDELLKRIQVHIIHYIEYGSAWLKLEWCCLNICLNNVKLLIPYILIRGKKSAFVDIRAMTGHCPYSPIQPQNLISLPQSSFWANSSSRAVIIGQMWAGLWNDQHQMCPQRQRSAPAHFHLFLDCSTASAFISFPFLFKQHTSEWAFL